MWGRPSWPPPQSRPSHSQLAASCVACVQTTPISFVARGNKGNRRRLHAGNVLCLIDNHFYSLSSRDVKKRTYFFI